MNIEEMLVEWGKLHDEYEEALQQYRTLEVKMWTVPYDNEEPFKLLTISGNYTGITIKTPDDVADIPAGCLLAIGGAEYFRASGYWLNSFDTKRDDREMFVRIMCNREHVHLIHMSY